MRLRPEGDGTAGQAGNTGTRRASSGWPLTDWLEFWLEQLCDVDHMQARGAWCRTALCSVQAVDPGAWPGADADSVNQASTKTGCFQQVRAGAVKAVLRLWLEVRSEGIVRR